MITLNNINNIFRDIANRHQQINEIFIGEDYDVAASEKMNHVLLIVNHVGVETPKTDNGFSSIEFEYNIKVVDLVDKDKRNQEDVYSDTLSIINDVVILINQSPDFINTPLMITNNITYNKLTEVFDTDVSGWETSFTLLSPLSLGYCETPITS